MDQNKALYLVLRVVHSNSNIKLLVNEGMSYPEIADTVRIAIEKKFVTYENDIITLSDLGNTHLLTLAIDYKRVNKDEWIKPDRKSQVAKISRNDIFVPNQDELKFL